MEEECGQNLRRLRELCPGIALTNFCYPFGRASLPRKAQLQKRFDSCRGIYEGINAGIADLGMLRVIELYDRTLTPDKLRRVLRQTRERNGWLIFATHDVAETPSWIGCSPRAAARNRGGGSGREHAMPAGPGRARGDRLSRLAELGCHRGALRRPSWPDSDRR